MSDFNVTGTPLYSEFISKSRYARWLDDENRRENWDETVERYISFFIKRFPHLENEIRNLKPFILQLKTLPSMRAIMTAGLALERDEVAGYNCSYVAIDSPRAFDEILYILMCGTGVGFSVERQFINKLPEVAEEFFESETTIIVPDSKIGWATSFRELLSLLWGGKIPKWDLSKLREAGAKLKTFGGRSSGPEPLDRLFKFAVSIFKKAAGRKLSSLECHDLVCKIAEVVVSGGVRRCLPFYSLVHTINGLKPISEVDIGELVLSKNGEYEKVLAKENVGFKSIITINTQMGKFECTPEHRMAVLSSLDGDIVWKEAKSLTSDDFLVFEKSIIEGIRTELPRWNYNKPQHSTTCKDIIIPSLDADMAWFFGNFHGDGYVITSNRETSDHNGYVSVACANDIPGQHKKVVSQLKRFGSDLKISDRFGTKENCSKPRVNSHQLSLYLSQFKTANKSINIPDFILLGTPDIRSAYIAGIHDADGNTGKPLCVTDSIYPDYLYQLQSLVSSLGIVSYIKLKREAEGNWKALYSLCIKGIDNIDKFNKMIAPHSVRAEYKKLKNRVKEQFGYVVPKKLLIESDYRNKFNYSYSNLNNNINLSWYKFEKEIGNKKFVPIKVENIIFDNEVKECYDLQIEDTECFVVNGLLTHNSALISLSNLSDDRMRNCKNGQWWIDNGQRTLSNNSAAYTEKPELEVFLKEWNSLYESKSGERGIFNRVSAQKQASKRGTRNKDIQYGCNPCSEILLRSAQFCNLTEVVIRENDSLEVIKEKVRVATILGTLQSTLTNFRYLRKIWQKNCEEERLLGVSLTGILDHPILGDISDEAKRWLTEMQEVAIQTNKEWSDILGINPSAAITCVKPSGTVSQLVNSSSGIHARYARYYIRTVRVDIKDPVCQFLQDYGFPCELDKMNASVMVFSFPIKSPDSAKIASEIDPTKQLEIWKQYQDYWCHHKPSCTVYYTDETFLSVGDWVWKHFDEISGISFLPYSDHVYEQAPYQPISAQKYEELASKMPQSIDWSKLSDYEKEDTTTSSKELNCSAGICEVVDLVK